MQDLPIKLLKDLAFSVDVTSYLNKYKYVKTRTYNYVISIQRNCGETGFIQKIHNNFQLQKLINLDKNTLEQQLSLLSTELTFRFERLNFSSTRNR